MIITKLHNGLGNQMFQYAAGLALAQHHKTTLKLDVSWFDRANKEEDHEKYGLSCFNVGEQFASLEECERYFPERRSYRKNSRLSRFIRSLSARPSPGERYFERGWGFDPLFWDLPINSYLDGYFQNPAYFKKISDLLRLHFSFRYPPSEKVSRQLETIQISSPSVFIHVRRGDYIGRNAVYGALGSGFYQGAINQLKQKLGSFTAFVFSDDLGAAEKELSLDVPHQFVRATEGANYFDKLRLMSSCDHAIISNSTFAWWGAWLIPSSEKTVIAPDPWHANTDPQFKTLKPVPENWLKMDRGLSAATL